MTLSTGAGTDDCGFGKSSITLPVDSPYLFPGFCRVSALIE